MERQAIAHALQHTKGDRMAAAMMLGIGRTTLYRKLKEYNLPADRDRNGDREKGPDEPREP